jgi:hypothetical protein
MLVQSGLSHNTKATVLVYRFPGLRFQRSTEIVGGNETVLWKDKLVSIGYRLGIYDLDLREIALVDMPPRDPSSRNICGGGPLRIFGDKAVVGANCGQLVVDLPSARIDRIIRMDSFFQSFDIAERKRPGAGRISQQLLRGGPEWHYVTSGGQRPLGRFNI